MTPRSHCDARREIAAGFHQGGEQSEITADNAEQTGSANGCGPERFLAPPGDDRGLQRQRYHQRTHLLGGRAPAGAARSKHAATLSVSAECPPCISWPRTLRVVSLFDVAVLQIRVAFQVADAVV